MFPQNDILNQMRRRRALEPPFATPPIALQQEAEQSKSDPWSERLPDGRTVNEAIMGTLKREQAPPVPQKISDPRDPSTLEVQPGYGKPKWEQWEKPIDGVTGEYISSPLPSASPNGPAPPPGIQLSTGQETRPSIVGGSRETNPLKREAARIRTMIENPTRQVDPSGAAGVSEPMGRLKAAGLGALFGLAQGGPETSLAARLAGGAAGAGVGAFKPRAVQDWQRRLEVEDAQGQLAKQQKLGLGQAQIESEQAETRQREAAPEIARAETERKARYDADRIRIQQQAAEGRISIADATRKLREMELEERKRHNLETEGIGRDRIKAAPDKSAENAAKRQAKIDLSSTLYKKAEALDGNARDLDEHIKKLEDGRSSLKNAPEPALPEELKPFDTQIADLKKQQQDLRTQANKLRADGDKARAEGESIPEQTAQTSQPGRRWSASRWATANPGKDVEAAKAAARAAGYQVVE